MARIRCSGGIVLDGDRRVWLVAEPGDEVDDSRRFPGAPVVVGPPDASRTAVDRARREARRLVAVGGPLVAAAGVEIKGFRTARLAGGSESRRDAVLAAVEVVGGKGLDRIGDTASVLVALFGVRATKRVGAAALDALAADQRSALRLAVATSDLLGPEQLETVLALRAPPGTEPVPTGDAVVLGEQLAAVLGPYTARRRVELLRSLWEDVVRWQVSARARGRARRRQISGTGIERWCRKLRRQEGEWWEAQAARQCGGRSDPWALATWVPGPQVWREALLRAFHESIAATTLLRTALAAEDEPLQAAVLAHLDALAHVGRTGGVGGPGGPGGPACQRAGMLAATATLASEPPGASGRARLGGRDTGQVLAAQLRGASDIAHATLALVTELGTALQALPPGTAPSAISTADLKQWRRVAGYGPVRAPASWSFRFLGLSSVEPLFARLDAADQADPADVEFLDDGLWIADLADVLAAWYGHPHADINGPGIDVDPQLDDDDDSRIPLLESVPLAAAGGAQLVAIGAQPPARPRTWSALASGLVAAAETLGLDEPFRLAPEVVAADRTILAGTDLVIEVARAPRQLAEWGNYMGNCIAAYSEDANRRFALVALRDADGKLAANIAIERGSRRWVVSQAFARFNEELPVDLRDLIGAWVDQIPVATAARGAGAGTRPRRTAPGGRRPPVRDRLLRASTRLGEQLGDVAAGEEVVRMAAALAPIAAELGWAGAGAGAGAAGDDRLGLFVAVARPRRPGLLAAATARALGPRCPLAELWQATSTRPLTVAVERLADPEVDLRRLADTIVPAALRLGLRDPRVRAARTVDIAAHRVRVAVAELLAAGDTRLDQAVVDRPHVGFVTAAVLTLTARDGQVVQPVDWVPVAADGSLPGRPRSSVRDESGPWVAARADAIEMGAAPERLDQVVADAPRRHLLVPSGWTTGDGWAGLWTRAHRATRALSR